MEIFACTPDTHLLPSTSAICLTWPVTITPYSGLALQPSCFLVWLLLESLYPQATHSREQSSWVGSISLRHNGEFLSSQKQNTLKAKKTKTTKKKKKKKTPHKAYQERQSLAWTKLNANGEMWGTNEGDHLSWGVFSIFPNKPVSKYLFHEIFWNQNSLQ